MNPVLLQKIREKKATARAYADSVGYTSLLSANRAGGYSVEPAFKLPLHRIACLAYALNVQSHYRGQCKHFNEARILSWRTCLLASGPCSEVYPFLRESLDTPETFFRTMFKPSIRHRIGWGNTVVKYAKSLSYLGTWPTPSIRRKVFCEYHAILSSQGYYGTEIKDESLAMLYWILSTYVPFYDFGTYADYSSVEINPECFVECALKAKSNFDIIVPGDLTEDSAIMAKIDASDTVEEGEYGNIARDAVMGRPYLPKCYSESYSKVYPASCISS